MQPYTPTPRPRATQTPATRTKSRNRPDNMIEAFDEVIDSMENVLDLANTAKQAVEPYRSWRYSGRKLQS